MDAADAYAAFATLKDKQRRLRDGFPEPLGLRVHRAISWVQAAERAAQAEDRDTAFIGYWIAFNAAYAQRADLHQQFAEQRFFEWYFDKIVSLDRDRIVYDAIWTRFAETIRIFINNRYVFAPYWRFQHGESGFEDWETRFAKEKRAIVAALGGQNTARVLAIVFDRLYVLRNQLIHGGATWKGSVNREQVRGGADIMAFLVPQFIDLMMDNPNDDWGLPPYPVIE